jgi:hypothetical protein
LAVAVASAPTTKSAPIFKLKHLGSIVPDVFGIASGNRGYHCEVHNNTLPTKCCSSVLDEDVVVRLRRERILVKDLLSAKGKMWE